MSKKIIIRIYTDGTVESSVVGVKGAKCTDYVKVVEEILEAKVVDSEFTSEYYEAEINIYEEEEITVEGSI